MRIYGLNREEISEIIKSIRLHLPKAKIFVFGSRVTGAHRKYSDLDIALDTGSPIDLAILTRIKERLSQSNIPILVDIVDYRSVSDDFKSIIDQGKVILPM